MNSRAFSRYLSRMLASGEFVELIGPLLIIVLAILVSVLKKSARKRASEETAQARRVREEARPAQTAKKPVSKPAAAQSTSMQGEAPGNARPRVQTTVKVTAHDHSGMFDGSMGGNVYEGADPCHDDRPAARMPSQYSDRIINRSLEEDDDEPVRNGLDLDWDDGKSLVKAFVMQEVLKRPSERLR